MAVESFLNFYGVVRLGEPTYKRKIERQGLLNKLDIIFLVCEGTSLEEKDQIRTTLERLGAQRNALVHNKAKELDPKKPQNDAPMPAAAHDSVGLMIKFFKLFDELVPDSAPYLKNAIDPDD